MGLLSRILGLKKKANRVKNSINTNYPNEYARILDFNHRIETLLNKDKYISRNDYTHLLEEYQSIPPFFETLQKSDMLKSYANINNIDIKVIFEFLEIYYQMATTTNEPSRIKEHNIEFIEHHLIEDKRYFDSILKECDPDILLDNEQREVILSDEDYTLVVAGAGAGKTTTVAAKVKYLTDKQGVKPEQILVISFTNKAVNELVDRINNRLNIACPISTFHSIGYSIMNMMEKNKRKIVDNGYMSIIVNKFLQTSVLNNQELVDKLVLFFSSYITAPYEGTDITEYFKSIFNSEHYTLKSNLQEYIHQVVDHKTKKLKTLNNEILRSQEEVNIANFLYLNQIDYEYEPFYKYQILDSNKPYTPDFVIKQDDKITYIEHFGITQNGTNNIYNDEDLKKYKKRVNEKILLHRKHKTDLIYTFSKYNDGQDYITHLKEELLSRGYTLNKRSSIEVYKKLASSEESKYIKRLTYLICNFISNFKTQGYKEEQFDVFYSTIQNVRTRIFLDICRACYLEYQKHLIQNNCLDFQDMINESAELIRKKKINKEKLGYRYIIVDEYQDISRQRYNLIKELSTLCNAKIIAVGDDWQSIYAFSGSILTLFTNFCKEFGYGKELKITHTYRNSQELINIAGHFVQKNSEQIRKSLISNKSIHKPIQIITYCDNKKSQHEGNPKGGSFHFLAEAVNQSIQEILNQHKLESKKGVPNILLLGRYGFDAHNMCKSGEFNYDEKRRSITSVKFGRKIKLKFLTVHSSKGLSADNVIIINAKDELFGFPSQIEDDPILRLVVNQDRSYTFAEERRLFYVALTRTKNSVFIIVPEDRPSVFIKELLNDGQTHSNITLKGNINLSSSSKIKNLCPICGYPMQRRMNKNFGLELWMCLNDQEVCGFMTNDTRGGDLCIHKCDNCKDGYLIVKPGSKGKDPILGCTNYKIDHSGCNRMMGREYYLKWKDDSIGKEYTL